MRYPGPRAPGRRSANAAGNPRAVPSLFRLDQVRPRVAYTVQYYDLVLGGILASLLAGVAVGWMTAYPIATTVPLFALVAAAIIGHGLFVNGPVDRPADLRDEVTVFE